VQRAKDASLMPGMWELPESTSKNGKTMLTLRHSITVTDYTVRVRQVAVQDVSSGRWIAKDRIESLPLTGLARKILRAAKVI
jgi:A/G-specific adenine glycosylase